MEKKSIYKIIVFCGVSFFCAQTIKTIGIPDKNGNHSSEAQEDSRLENAAIAMGKGLGKFAAGVGEGLKNAGVEPAVNRLEEWGNTGERRAKAVYKEVPKGLAFYAIYRAINNSEAVATAIGTAFTNLKDVYRYFRP